MSHQVVCYLYAFKIIGDLYIALATFDSYIKSVYGAAEDVKCFLGTQVRVKQNMQYAELENPPLHSPFGMRKVMFGGS
jgi:hypothetical protein